LAHLTSSDFRRSLPRTESQRSSDIPYVSKRVGIQQRKIGGFADSQSSQGDRENEISGGFDRCGFATPPLASIQL
jgi:hypothetical protein